MDRGEATVKTSGFNVNAEGVALKLAFNRGEVASCLHTGGVRPDQEGAIVALLANSDLSSSCMSCNSASRRCFDVVVIDVPVAEENVLDAEIGMGWSRPLLFDFGGVGRFVLPSFLTRRFTTGWKE